MASPETIQSLWLPRLIGGRRQTRLSPVEQLCLRSFVAAGHPFELYLYGKPHIGIPTGIALKDAEDIVPYSAMSALRKRGMTTDDLTDYFRATLLHERGGWWADTDVFCLKPLRFKQNRLFARYSYDDGAMHVNSALMKLPPRDALAAKVLARFRRPWSVVKETPRPRRAAKHLLSTRIKLLFNRSYERHVSPLGWGMLGGNGAFDRLTNAALRRCATPDLLFGAWWVKKQQPPSIVMSLIRPDYRFKDLLAPCSAVSLGLRLFSVAESFYRRMVFGAGVMEDTASFLRGEHDKPMLYHPHSLYSYLKGSLAGGRP